MMCSVVKGLPLINEAKDNRIKNFIKKKAVEIEVKIIEHESVYNHIQSIISMKSI